MKQLKVLAIVAALAMAACSEPLSRETFIRGRGPFEFDVPMSDTTFRYDFTFYTRLDAGRERLDGFSGRDITIRWISPSDSVYEEIVFLPMTDSLSGFYTRQVVAPYREGVLPFELGDWKMRVTVDSVATVPGFRGLGLVMTKRKI